LNFFFQTLSFRLDYPRSFCIAYLVLSLYFNTVSSLSPRTSLSLSTTLPLDDSVSLCFVFFSPLFRPTSRLSSSSHTSRLSHLLSSFSILLLCCDQTLRFFAPCRVVIFSPSLARNSFFFGFRSWFFSSQAGEVLYLVFFLCFSLIAGRWR